IHRAGFLRGGPKADELLAHASCSLLPQQRRFFLRNVRPFGNLVAEQLHTVSRAARPQVRAERCLHVREPMIQRRQPNVPFAVAELHLDRYFRHLHCCFPSSAETTGSNTFMATTTRKSTAATGLPIAS